MEVGIGHQALNLKSVLEVPALLFFVIPVERTIRVFIELAETSVLDVASQTIELDIVPSQDFKVA